MKGKFDTSYLLGVLLYITIRIPSIIKHGVTLWLLFDLAYVSTWLFLAWYLSPNQKIKRKMKKFIKQYGYATFEDSLIKAGYTLEYQSDSKKVWRKDDATFTVYTKE